MVIGREELFADYARVGKDAEGNEQYSDYTSWQHETLQHIPQSYVLGPGYFVAHGLSWVSGAIIGWDISSDAVHTNGFMERYWGDYPNW